MRLESRTGVARRQVIPLNVRHEAGVVAEHARILGSGCRKASTSPRGSHHEKFVDDDHDHESEQKCQRRGVGVAVPV